jgi:hypothetical protein
VSTVAGIKPVKPVKQEIHTGHAGNPFCPTGFAATPGRLRRSGAKRRARAQTGNESEDERTAAFSRFDRLDARSTWHHAELKP